MLLPSVATVVAATTTLEETIKRLLSSMAAPVHILWGRGNTTAIIITLIYSVYAWEICTSDNEGVDTGSASWRAAGGQKETHLEV